MPPSIRRSSWGTAPASSLQEAREVEHFRLDVDSLAIEVVTLGASLLVVETPDETGAVANVVLGLPDLAAVLDRPRNHNLGATIGRYANRIGGAAFTIDGVRSTLQANEPPNQLHGGEDGWGRLVWSADTRTGDDWAELTLMMVSPDGDNGFPGEVTATTTYRVEPGVLTMTHEATTTAPTMVSMTNHGYWNLAGSGSARGHEVQVAASQRLAVDDGKIPTGDLIDNNGTGYDLREPRSVAAIVREFGGLDDCYVLDADLAGRPAAVLSDRGSGRRMEIETDQPSIQVYTGNYLGGEFEQYGAVCLETQQFPNAPNIDSFPSTVLRPGERYLSTTTHRFSTSPRFARLVGPNAQNEATG